MFFFAPPSHRHVFSFLQYLLLWCVVRFFSVSQTTHVLLRFFIFIPSDPWAISLSLSIYIYIYLLLFAVQSIAAFLLLTHLLSVFLLSISVRFYAPVWKRDNGLCTTIVLLIVTQQMCYEYVAPIQPLNCKQSTNSLSL